MSSIQAALLLSACLATGQPPREVVIYEAPGIRVYEKKVPTPAREEQELRYLLQYQVHLGSQFRKPKDPHVTGVLMKDYSRSATTYYHRRGPFGQALERFNWFHGPDDFPAADFRLPANLIASGPGAMLCGLWSEPPVAVIGMEAGTPAAYARPCQTMHFYEGNRRLAALTFPILGREPYFTFAQDAYSRGAFVRHIPGAPRESLTKQGGDGFYHVMAIEVYKDSSYSLQRDLLTQDAMAVCMKKLAPQGILCYHVSNRFYNVVPILAAAADNLGLFCRQANDAPRDQNAHRLGHFHSSWLFVTREKKRLDDLELQSRQLSITWSTPPAAKRFLWREGQPNSLNGLMRYDPQLGWIRERVSSKLGFLRYLGLSRQEINGIDQSWQQVCQRINEFLMLIRDY